MKEDEVYFHTKSVLEQNGFVILGGQPPRGTDIYPVVEIKDANNDARGSRGSFKPDLVVASESTILIVECKPSFSIKDVEKLREIRASRERRQALAEEINQRGLLERHGLRTCFVAIGDIANSFCFAVAYCGDEPGALDMVNICIGSRGVGKIFDPSNDLG